jgi:putative flavoprotein involved in K+ transport
VRRTTVLIIGAGQAGLAMSRCLSARGIEHVVLERGRIAERWRHRWDSLRLLTPNWMTRLPGFAYRGDDPDGFMPASELVTLLEGYASSGGVPVETHTAVHGVGRLADAFRVSTSRGEWRAASVVIASGYCDRPAIPAMAGRLTASVQQIAADAYRNPQQLSAEGVLIVGASATGVQLAEEIQRSGRQVTLAVGRHTRLPRRYRGRDIMWWLDRLGMLGQDASAVNDLAVSRAQPSLQLVGRPDYATVDLLALHQMGVRLVGRVTAIDGARVDLADDLIARTAAADIKLAMIRMRIDEYARSAAIARGDAEPLAPTWWLAPDPPSQLDLRRERIGTVVWATGYRRAYHWLRLPVLDERGDIMHDAGVTPCPGLYVLGMNFQRRRNSSFIDGVGRDAEYLAQHIAAASCDTHSEQIYA